MSIDSAHETLQRVLGEVSANINNIYSEEDSKIQIIVRLFVEVLGWRHSDIGAERKHENGFSDLLISDGQNPALLCEAKRIGELTVETAEVKKLRYLKISGPSLAKAKDGISQAVGYAALNGILLTVLTDGIRWIVFKSFTPGSNYASHEAFVFPSLEAVEADFSVFYELLSKDSFSKRLFNSHFDILHNSRNVLNQPLKAPMTQAEIALLSKTELAFDLDQIFSAFFGRLAGQNDDDMLVDCFVESRESRFADLSLEKIAANVLGNISPPDRDVNVELRTLIETAVDVEAGQTVFIVGPTGSGKTTFLDRFFKKTLSSLLRERCLVVRANCLDSTGRKDTLLHWFTETLIIALEKALYVDGTPNWDELQGLYFTEYDRRRKGVDSQLYLRDKQAFKEKFGTFLDERVESDREGYLKRILTDVVHNRHMLPIVIVDNTDEFSAEVKAEIFQFSQAIRRSAHHCIIMFPVTDKSAWSFSKTDLYGIYKSKSFFLPTPPPREVFRRRIDFIRSRMVRLPTAAEKKTYFVGKGIQLSIDKISSFASVLEDVFVHDDYASRVIGELSNFNIRRTLELAQRVITSSVLKIDDIFKAFAVGQVAALSHPKFVNALLKGDYELYRQSDNHLVYPVFQAGDKFRQSPLLIVRILALLDGAQRAARNVEDRHLSVQSIIDYFSALGHSETALEWTLIQMLQSGLAEAYDPSVEVLLPSQRLAITFSGHQHLGLALNDEIFFEQMALTTAILDHNVADRIKGVFRSNSRLPDRLVEIRSMFVDYLIAEDLRNLVFPVAGDQYDTQRFVTDRIRRFMPNAFSPPTTEAPEPTLVPVLTGVLCIVDWFDPERGFGFVDVEGQTQQAFLHKEKIKEGGLEQAFDGDKLLCDISRNSKGLFVESVHDFENSSRPFEEVEGQVIRLFHDRKYGFVKIADKSKDAFFRYSIFPSGLPAGFVEGSKCRVEVSLDKSGESYQVRRILEVESRA